MVFCGEIFRFQEFERTPETIQLQEDDFNNG